MALKITVRAFWDQEAKVWVAESEDVPGLATEAPTMEELIRKLRVMIPELLSLNVPGPERGGERTEPGRFESRFPGFSIRG